MKREFLKPMISVSYFASEAVVTTASADIPENYIESLQQLPYFQRDDVQRKIKEFSQLLEFNT